MLILYFYIFQRGFEVLNTIFQAFVRVLTRPYRDRLTALPN